MASFASPTRFVTQQPRGRLGVSEETEEKPVSELSDVSNIARRFEETLRKK